MRRALAFARWLLAALVLATACANPAVRRTENLGGVLVSVGTMESSRLHGSPTRPAGAIPKQLEDLFDLFWDAGCAGEHLRLASLTDEGDPEVVCSLPGRSNHMIAVVAHIDSDPTDSEVGDDWQSAASLPTLYRSLGIEARTHTFVFAGFGEASRAESAWRSIRRLANARDAEIHAVVDLRGLDSGDYGIWTYASDPQLRDDLFSVGLAVGRPPESFRQVRPPRRERARRLATRIPSITIGSFARGKAPGVAAPPDPDRGEVLRVIAFFLGYIDQRLAPAPPPGR